MTLKRMQEIGEMRSQGLKKETLNLTTEEINFWEAIEKGMGMMVLPNEAPSQEGLELYDENFNL